MPNSVRFVRNSETSMFSECKLKWYFSYHLGFQPSGTNPHFWLGTFVHHCLSEWYLGRVSNPAHLFWMISEEWLEEARGLQITVSGEDIGFDDLTQIEDYAKMGVTMLEGYMEWSAEQDDFTVLDSEVAYYIEMEDVEGRPFTFVGRFDILTENSEGIRVRDFKTAGDFRDTKTVHTYAQFRRYPWMVAQAHPEWADDVVGSAWVGLRKIVPSNRSKPPYFGTELIDLTPDEIHTTGEELVAEVTDILNVEEKLNNGVDPRLVIYPHATFDCSFRCDYFHNGLCTAWRAGLDVHEQGLLHGTWGNDGYEEYKKDEEESVLTFGKRTHD